MAPFTYGSAELIISADIRKNSDTNCDPYLNSTKNYCVRCVSGCPGLYFKVAFFCFLGRFRDPRFSFSFHIHMMSRYVFRSPCVAFVEGVFVGCSLQCEETGALSFHNKI